MNITSEQIETAVARLVIQTGGAAKRGRDRRLPYVPIIKFNQPTGHAKTQQILNVAFASRSAAVDFANSRVEGIRESIRAKLVDPGWRALRKSVGLPEDIV